MSNNTGINKAILVGHIGKEPRRHSVEGQQEVLCFPLVTNEFIKKNGESVEHIEWHQIKLAASAADDLPVKLCKGQLVYVEGKVQTKSFVDSTNIKRYKTEISAYRVEHVATKMNLEPEAAINR